MIRVRARASARRSAPRSRLVVGENAAWSGRSGSVSQFRHHVALRAVRLLVPRLPLLCATFTDQVGQVQRPAHETPGILLVDLFEECLCVIHATSCSAKRLDLLVRSTQAWPSVLTGLSAPVSSFWRDRLWLTGSLSLHAWDLLKQRFRRIHGYAASDPSGWHRQPLRCITCSASLSWTPIAGTGRYDEPEPDEAGPVDRVAIARLSA